MISLQKISQQLSWIDILTKNTGGVGALVVRGRVRALLAARAIRVRAVLAARAISVPLAN